MDPGLEGLCRQVERRAGMAIVRPCTGNVAVIREYRRAANGWLAEPNQCVPDGPPWVRSHRLRIGGRGWSRQMMTSPITTRRLVGFKGIQCMCRRRPGHLVARLATHCHDEHP